MTTAPAKPETLEATEIRESLAPLYRVLVHNDDRTPFDFVIAVLIRIFKLPPERAMAVTLEAHHGGLALIRVEPKEHAEFHLEQVHSLARGRSYPLTCTMEPA